MAETQYKAHWEKCVDDSNMLLCGGKIFVNLFSEDLCEIGFLGRYVRIEATDKEQAIVAILKTRLRSALASLEAMDE